MRILYIDCDSLRPDHLGCYGYHRDTSPNIDRLASSGRRFTNYYASDAPCLPSRTALFTSRFGIHTGVINHGGINASMRPRGPNREFNTQMDEYRTWMTVLREAGLHTALISVFPQHHGAIQVLDGFDEWHHTDVFRSDQVYPHAKEWLEDNASDEDWYLHVNFWDPHTPYDTPLEYGNPFEDEPAPEWPDEETIQEQYESYGPHSAQDVHGWGEDAPFERTPDEIASREDFEQWIDGYDTGIRYMDDHIGRLLDLLESEGVLEDTLVIVSADHGENQGELNVYGDHHTADDRSCRVPLIISGPGVKHGVDDDFHYQVDLAPTITEFVDGDIPGGWDGQSFANSLTDGVEAGRDYLVVSQGAWSCQRGVRWDDWLLIRTYHDGLKEFAPIELYDLAADPHETTNLAQEKPDVARKGLSLLDQWVSNRLLEAATGEAGGNPDAPRTLTDPMLEVIREGGPHHAKVEEHVESYAERLRTTGREEHAAELEAHPGYVEQSIDSYFRSE
ncbi:sulfatase family protein [Halorussus salinisoli]|uniref:sulfatase family protein n=1 Tax=Halorussus salinisoli TaxID=2558242 RepID=UPI0010C1739B|nr:sulfatase [Halorussus salinisoli]